MKKVLIGMCTGGQVEFQTVLSLIGLLSTEGVMTVSIRASGYKPFNLNGIVEAARRLGATHFLSVDCDMEFPTDALKKLLAHDKDIVGTNYLSRMNDQETGRPFSTLKFEKNGKYVATSSTDFPPELFECAAVGLGLTLIDMKVFDKLKKPYFYTKETPELHTEDVVFCKEARKAGFKVWCDPTIDVGHVSKVVRRYSGETT